MTKVKQFPDQSGKKTDDKKTRNNEKRADDSLLMSLSGGGGAGGFRSADADGVGDDDDAYDDGQSGEELYDGEAGANDDYESGEEPDDSEAGGYDKGESGEELYDGEADDYDDYESSEKSDDGEAGDYDDYESGEKSDDGEVDAYGDDESGEADFSDKKKTSVKDVKKADTITFNPRRLRVKNGRSVRDPEDSGDELSYNEKIKQYRAMVWRIRSILVVLAAVVIVLAAMFVSNRHFSRAELIPVREFASEDGASCISFADYILQYGPNGATCADKDGRVKWSITYEMDQPILDISGNIAAIADYGGRTIYVMNTAKQLYSVTTSLPIHKVSASESGEVAAVMDDTSVTWIRLYSKTGKEIAYFVRSMEENGYPMDVAVSPNGEAVCVSNLMMKDTTVKTVISFYNFGKAGKNYDQHKVVDFEYDNEVFPYVRYMGNNICTAASDSRFVVFDTSSVEPKNSINNMITENLQGVFRSDKYIGLLFTDLTRENLYRLDIYGKDGKKVGAVGFSMAFNDLQIAGSRIYINNDQSMQIYTLDGREVFNGGFDKVINALIPSSRLNGLIAVSENEIYEIKLR